MRPRTLRRIAGALLIAVLAGSGALAAQQYGSLFGVVADNDGSALPGVTVTLEGMGAPRVTVTDENGNYRFPGLDPGSYYLKAELDGFSTVEQPNVVVALNRSTTINFTLSSAVEDVITVTSESPLLDERQLAKGANISQVELEKIPTARDPWSVLNQAPGVLVDRINVGGNESGQQSYFRGPGVNDDENDFLVDGVQITDMSAIGGSPTYYDFEQFEAVELGTGGPDVTKNSAGVSVNMVTKRGTNEFRGTARFLSAKGDGLGFLGQSTSDFNCGDLGPNQDCDTFETNSINSISEYGFESGGAAIIDRLWLWGSYGVNDIQQFNAGGGADDTLLENTSVKLNVQLSSANSFLASWNNGDKKKFGRGASPARADETTWDQRGPSALWKLEDTHVFSSNLYLTGTYSKTDLGFSLQPKSGCVDASCPVSQETLWASDGVWRQNYLNGFSRRPEETLKLDGSYFFNTGSSTSHELKFGGRMRQMDGFSNFQWPGRNIVNIAGENFGADPGPSDFFFLYRRGDSQDISAEYASLWLQDTVASGNWTINAGFRYDFQTGEIQPGSTGPSAAPDLFPTVTVEQPIDSGFDWSSITPRLGVTYALGEERDTLLRASFSQFPQALSVSHISWLNPAAPANYGAYAYFAFTDSNDNNLFEEGESYAFLFGTGFDVKNPSTNGHTVDPGLDPEMTSELVAGVEHSLLPEFVVGASYTYRLTEDILEARDRVRPVTSDDQFGRVSTAADFVEDGTTSAVLPDGSVASTPTFSLRPSLETTGFAHRLNGSREIEYHGMTLTFNKRLANRWALRGFVNFGEGEWNVPRDYTANNDPNDSIATNTNNGEDSDGAVYYVQAGGSKSDTYMHSKWQWNLTGIYQVAPDRPWGFNLSANLYGRDGSLIPYNNSVSGGDGLQRTTSLLGADIDRFSNDDVTTLDMRVEKTFAATSNVNFTFGIDLFNALNEATVLSREPALTSGRADNVQDLISPRIWKLGVRVSWK